MGDSPVNPDSGREGRRRRLPSDPIQPHRGSRRLGIIGRYMEGAHIDPSSNLFDYGLFVAILVIGLLIARSWHGGGLQPSAQPAPEIRSGISASNSPSGAPSQMSSSISPSGGGQGGPMASGGGQPTGLGGANNPDTVLAADRADAGELDGDNPPPPARHRKSVPKNTHREPATYTN